MMPRWVVIWIGGPVVAALLGLGLFNATRGNLASERLVKLEVTQDLMVQNQESLMKYFNLVPASEKK